MRWRPVAHRSRRPNPGSRRCTCARPRMLSVRQRSCSTPSTLCEASAVKAAAELPTAVSDVEQDLTSARSMAQSPELQAAISAGEAALAQAARLGPRTRWPHSRRWTAPRPSWRTSSPLRATVRKRPTRRGSCWTAPCCRPDRRSRRRTTSSPPVAVAWARRPGPGWRRHSDTTTTRSASPAPIRRPHCSTRKPLTRWPDRLSSMRRMTSASSLRAAAEAAGAVAASGSAGPSSAAS